MPADPSFISGHVARRGMQKAIIVLGAVDANRASSHHDDGMSQCALKGMFSLVLSGGNVP